MRIQLSRRRITLLLLLLALLGAQLGWVSHEYQAHDNGQVCELCVSGAQLGHGLTNHHTLTLDPAQGYTLFVAAAPAALATTSRTPLQPRAPPFQLL